MHAGRSSPVSTSGPMRPYAGALLVVSHDERFLANISIGRRLNLADFARQ